MSAPEQPRTVTCKGCGGTAPAPPHAAPVGWYSLTVALPPEHRRPDGREYAWVGLYCSAACLAANGSELAEAEALARMTYQAVIPEPAEPWTVSGNPLGRRGRRP